MDKAAADAPSEGPAVTFGYVGGSAKPVDQDGLALGRLAVSAVQAEAARLKA